MKRAGQKTELFISCFDSFVSFPLQPRCNDHKDYEGLISVPFHARFSRGRFVSRFTPTPVK